MMKEKKYTMMLPGDNAHPSDEINKMIKFIMIKEVDSNSDELNDICEDCKKEDISVSQNLILTGFKICESCRLSKNIFPV